ncbi:heterokaryon incompatibility protein-domain-containing protein [Xylariaceae sp. FL0594]|nr:heterokaryon incompatibility protein-domain-containing protein [Xylariaceae sp. FL0594]
MEIPKKRKLTTEDSYQREYPHHASLCRGEKRRTSEPITGLETTPPSDDQNRLIPRDLTGEPAFGSNRFDWTTSDIERPDAYLQNLLVQQQQQARKHGGNGHKNLTRDRFYNTPYRSPMQQVMPLPRHPPFHLGAEFHGTPYAPAGYSIRHPLVAQDPDVKAGLETRLRIRGKSLHQIKLMKLGALGATNKRSKAPIQEAAASELEQSTAWGDDDAESRVPIPATLETFPINGCPPFVALSYVWGSDDPLPTLCVDGEPFKIRDNLTTALKQLRTLCPDTYIWTDAVCIDQRNEVEKSHIVQHMGEIFYAARRVYAWLGPADPSVVAGDSSDALWVHLQELGDLFWQEAGPDRSLVDTPFDMDPILNALLPDLNDRMGRPIGQGGFPTGAYSKFSNRAYWQRIWVLQEVCLARDLIFCCGSKTMPSRTLAGALILLESYQKYIVTNTNRPKGDPSVSSSLKTSTSNLIECSKLEEFAFTSSSYPEMHRLIVCTSVYWPEVHSLRIAMTNFCIKELPRGSHSTDPRDMIFGLLGFANPQERSFITSDYRRSVEQVYRDATRALLRNGWTDLLAWAQPLEKEIKTLPTWVPDFSSTILETMCSQGQAKSWLAQFRASASFPLTSLRTGDKEESDHLCWTGVVVDTIDKIGSLWYPMSLSASSTASASASGFASQSYGSRAQSQVESYSQDYSSSVERRTRMKAYSVSYEAVYAFLSDAAEFAREGLRRRYPDVFYSFSPRLSPSVSDLAHRVEEMCVASVPCADQLVVNSRCVRGGDRVRSAYLSAVRHAEKCVERKKKSLSKKTKATIWEQEEEEEEEVEIPEEGRAYVETILRWVKKRLILTPRGHIGLGPGDVRKGDLLVLLQNCNAPYILRKVHPWKKKEGEKAEECSYELVGEAYVWGIMDGEYEPRREDSGALQAVTT